MIESQAIHIYMSSDGRLMVSGHGIKLWVSRAIASFYLECHVSRHLQAFLTGKGQREARLSS